MQLKVIKYNFIISLTKLFLERYNQGQIKSLEELIKNVKALAPFILNMTFIYDESIWLPDQPKHYKNLIEFKVQLQNEIEYLPFRLYLKEPETQEAMLFNQATTLWDYF